MHRFSVAGLTVALFLCSRAAGAEHYTARFPKQSVRDIQFSPKSDLLAVLANGKITIFNPADGKLIRELSPDAFRFGFNADGKKLFVSGRDADALVDPRTGAVTNVPRKVPAAGFLGFRLNEEAGKLLIHELNPAGPAAKSGKIHDGDEVVGLMVGTNEKSLIGFKPDQAISQMGAPAGIRVTLRIIPKGTLDPISVELRRMPMPVTGKQRSFAKLVENSSPNVCVLYLANSLVLLDTNSGEFVSVLQPVDLKLAGDMSTAVSPDGKKVALISRRIEQKLGTTDLGLEIFDVRSQLRSHHSPVRYMTFRGLQFSPDSNRVLVADDDRISVYDLEKKAWTDPVLVGFDPIKEKAPGQGLLINDGFASPHGLFPRHNGSLVASFDVSADGKMVAIGSWHSTCLFWSTEQHKRLAEVGTPSTSSTRTHPVRISPDGRWLVYFTDGTLHIVSLSETFPHGPQDSAETTSPSKE
jgi:WD40 repeat protein